MTIYKQSASFAIDIKNINVRINDQTIAIKDKLSFMNISN